MHREARRICRGNEEAGLFAREAAYTILQQIYGAVPPATIKDRVLASTGGNKVSSHQWLSLLRRQCNLSQL